VLIPQIYRDHDPSPRTAPTRKLSGKVNAVDIIFYRWALFVQPGLQVISEPDDENMSSTSIVENPHVVCRASLNLNYE